MSPDKLHITGACGGPDGVKLEEMILITEAEAVPLGLTPYAKDKL